MANWTGIVSNLYLLWPGITTDGLCDDPGYYEHNGSDSDENMLRLEFEAEAVQRGVTIDELCNT